jgi:SAM-dependent methyltransferase
LQNKQKEIEHDQKIKEDAEFFWGWATTAGKLRAERRSDLIISRVKSRGFSRVLEIGSGTGIFTESFCKAGFDVYGVDISFDLLKELKIKHSRKNLLNLSVADVEDMPYCDGSFDAVVGVCVLHHFEIVPALKEIGRVLKKGGIFLFSEPNMMNPQLALQKNIKPIKRLSILGETEDETAFFKWQMRNLLETMSFKEISIMPFDFLHPWTPKPLIPFVEKLGFCLEKIPLLKEIAGSLLIHAVK